MWAECPRRQTGKPLALHSYTSWWILRGRSYSITSRQLSLDQVERGVANILRRYRCYLYPPCSWYNHLASRSPPFILDPTLAVSGTAYPKTRPTHPSGHIIQRSRASIIFFTEIRSKLASLTRPAHSAESADCRGDYFDLTCLSSPPISVWLYLYYFIHVFISGTSLQSLVYIIHQLGGGSLRRCSTSTGDPMHSGSAVQLDTSCHLHCTSLFHLAPPRDLQLEPPV